MVKEVNTIARALFPDLRPEPLKTLLRGKKTFREFNEVQSNDFVNEISALDTPFNRQFTSETHKVETSYYTSTTN